MCIRYCPSCKTDENAVVKAGEKPKESKKKAKMMSANSSSKRDWGKVMLFFVFPVVRVMIIIVAVFHIVNFLISCEIYITIQIN